MLYVKVLLDGLIQVGPPSALPDDLNGLDAVTLADMSWFDGVYKPYGFWPVTVIVPSPIPNGTLLGDTVSNVVLDPETKTATARRNLIPREGYVPQRVTKIAFSRLFTFQERAILNAAKATIRGMTPNDYGNPFLMPIVALELIMDAFELPAEFIELNHPDTILAIGTVFVQAGILTRQRAEQILAYQMPDGSPAG